MRKHHSFRAADGRYPAFRQPLDPGHHGAVVEAQNEFGLHGDPTAQAPDEPDDVGEAVPQSDEIDQLDCASAVSNRVTRISEPFR